LVNSAEEFQMLPSGLPAFWRDVLAGGRTLQG
jgi:hypothetical protein